MIVAEAVALASDQTMMCGRVLFALGLPLVYLLSCAWSFATAPTVTDSVLFPSGHTSLEQLLMPALQRESDEQNQTSLLLPTRSVTLRPFPPRPGRENKVRNTTTVLCMCGCTSGRSGVSAEASWFCTSGRNRLGHA